MNQITTIRLIAGREISERLRSRLAWAMTAITKLLVAALIVTPALLRHPPKAIVVGLVGSSGQTFGPALQASAKAMKMDIRVVDVTNDADVRTRVADGSLDVALSVGYGLQSFAYAAAGAMVARQEEVQFVSMPFGMVLIGSLLLVYAAIATPDAPWVHVLSFVPPLAPILTPPRLALNHMAVWEMPLGVLIMAVSVYGMMHLAARIYTVALVRSGARLTWKDAVRLRLD